MGSNPFPPANANPSQTAYNLLSYREQVQAEIAQLPKLAALG
ncbi:MAG: hypothetical protein ACQCN6_05430 [Candidatus Bathyarchaeia archaeon]